MDMDWYGSLTPHDVGLMDKTNYCCLTDSLAPHQACHMLDARCEASIMTSTPCPDSTWFILLKVRYCQILLKVRYCQGIALVTDYLILEFKMRNVSYRGLDAHYLHLKLSKPEIRLILSMTFCRTQ